MVKYSSVSIDRTFSALADATRRAILLRLRDEPGLSVSELARPLSLKLPGLMKHLDVLSDAGLITRTKTGRTVSVQPVVAPMREAMEWLHRYESMWTASLDRLVALVEQDEQADPTPPARKAKST
ncbi:ArsR family transcriptional regulator [Massilia arenosa]|uniref:ArsR family transcriptional regulator n=1 Tax=Zemynaea arenosa TaxID=2561931 RepID=A0A4Y9SPA1_9BURK|nr:metalloregulator ArsR/SmtB family transcription factor [Massilia arenosa]TFW28345.1 ArsR family transcriptional regulator [Massilia arenosa]